MKAKNIHDREENVGHKFKRFRLHDVIMPILKNDSSKNLNLKTNLLQKGNQLLKSQKTKMVL